MSSSSALTPSEAAAVAQPFPRGWTLYPDRGEEIVGTVLAGRFEVQERIGSGGMASVYVCKDRALHGLAALKILRGTDLDARRRFAAESRLLANLRHPHLVQVLVIGETEDGAPYMVLEYLPGQSLDARLLRRGPLPWRDVVEIAVQVAGALAALHHVGVIHRDVKPSNVVLLDSGSGRPLIKLIDLGIAKVHDWALVQGGGFTPAPRHQTDFGKIVGTPGFCPPESALVEADPRFDVFALGMTVYQLCTGVLPTPGEYRPMKEVRPGCEVPPVLEVLIASAVAALPEDRVASALEFQQRLETIRSAEIEDGGSVLFDGCYELIEVLGAGAKAEVYRAYHREAGRYVALKLLSTRSKVDVEERVRFAREARVLAAVRHPALPELYDCRVGAKRKQPYLAMTLARGKPAGDFIHERVLTPADVSEIGKQLAGALAALHERGILHRDLNVSNILIDLGRQPKAMLVDLGMAELTDRFYAVVEQRYPTPPEARVRLGSGGLEHLEWSAPEVRAGKGWTDRSDVFSLGLLLYKLLTGKRPFAGGSTEMLPPRNHAPGCPRALERALRFSLCHEPADRFTAIELNAALDEAAEELREESLEVEADAGDEAGDDAGDRAVVLATPERPPSHAPPSLVPGAASSPRERRRIAVPGLAVIVGVGLGILGTLALQQGVAPEATSTTVQRERGEGGAQASVAPDDQPDSSTQPAVDSSTATPSGSPDASTRSAVDNAAATPSEPPEMKPRTAPPAPGADTDANEPPRRARPLRAVRSETFADVMTRLEPKIRRCAREAGLAGTPVTVQVRYKGGAVDGVRVLQWGKDHPLSMCIEPVIRKAQPPAGTRPIEDFTFFAGYNPAAK